MSECGSEFNLSLEVGLTDGGLDSCDGLVEVFGGDVGGSQLRGLHLEQGHVDAARVARVRRLVEAVGGHAELSRSLTSTDGHHHRLLHHDGDI